MSQEREILRKLRYGQNKNFSAGTYYSDVSTLGMVAPINCNLITPNSTYSSVLEIIKRIEDVQKKFSRLTKSRNNLLYSCALKVMDYLNEKLFGIPKNRMTIEELFEEQLSNINELNLSLASLIHHSKEELKALETNVDKAIRENGLSCDKKETLVETISATLFKYEQIKEKLQNTSKHSPEYFETKIQLKSLERRISELQHVYALTSDIEVHNQLEEHYLQNIEVLFRTSLQVAERIEKRSRLISNMLWKTKKSYQTIGDVIKATTFLSEGMSVLSDFTKEIHNLLYEGIRQMCAIIDNIHLNSATDCYNKRVESMIRDIRFVTYKIGLRAYKHEYTIK